MIVRRENYDGFKNFDFFNDGEDTSNWLYRMGREQEGDLLIELTANAQRNPMSVDTAMLLVSGRRGRPHDWDHELMEAAEVLRLEVLRRRNRYDLRQGNPSRQGQEASVSWQQAVRSVLPESRGVRLLSRE